MRTVDTGHSMPLGLRAAYARSDQKPILMVEEIDDDVFLFKHALKKAGFTNPVHVVLTAESARQYLLAGGAFADRYSYPFPSIVALEFHLPDCTGLEFLAWIRRQPELQGLHRIVITADQRPEILHKSYALGADSVLYKPCTPEDLQGLAQRFPERWLPERSGKDCRCGVMSGWLDERTVRMNATLSADCAVPARARRNK